MIAFMVGVMQFFLTLSMIIFFLCICLLGLATLDYMLDLDIKQKITNELGPRPLLKELRIKILKLFKKFEGPDKFDLLGKSEGMDILTDEDYDKEIHDLVDEIERNRKDAEYKRPERK